MRVYINDIFTGWKKIFSEKRTRRQLLVILMLYIFLFKYCRIIMTGLEARQGVQVNDLFLKWIPPVDLSLITFVLTYAALATFLLSSVKRPATLILGLQGYCLLIMMRTLAIYFVALEPPAGMIILQDPVTILFMSTPRGGYIVKDLFFSGHVSAVVLFYFVVENRITKNFLLILAILVGSFLLIQHVHYTMDIIAAPFFSLLAYKASFFINKMYYRVNLDTVVALD